jgi:hypothetical protein
VEQDKDTLIQGNLSELWEKVQEAAKSGYTGNLEKFIKETVDKGKSKTSGGLEQYHNMIPGASEITPKFLGLFVAPSPSHGCYFAPCWTEVRVAECCWRSPVRIACIPKKWALKTGVKIACWTATLVAIERI